MDTAGIKISPVNMDERKKLDIRPGDTVRVLQKVIERTKEKDKVKERTRLQAFEGLVLAHKHGKENGAAFTVRKVVDGVGVEKIFPLYSPGIDKVEVLRRSKVRRAKLYHIRKKAAKEIRKEMSNSRMIKTEEPVASPELKTEKTEEKKAE